MSRAAGENGERTETDMEFSHFDADGSAVMVDVSGKKETEREAVAQGVIRMSRECFRKVMEGHMAKGDVLGTARIAGIMGAKKTSELIPLCHLLQLTSVKIDFESDGNKNEITAFCRVKTTGKTGVEMEALLTIYDMCKAIDKRMEMHSIHLCTKTGGKSGDFSF